MVPRDPPSAEGEYIPSSGERNGRSDVEVWFYLDDESLWSEHMSAVPRVGETVMFDLRKISHSRIADDIGSIVFEVGDVWWRLHGGLTVVEVYLTEHDRTHAYEPADRDGGE